jgi:phosphoribosylglycinamide formyltransferase-1
MGDADANARRIAVLASGSGSNLQAIVDACRAGHLAASVVLVVSDRADAFALERATAADIPCAHLARRDDEPRRGYDARLADLVETAAPDVVVLAGWMRILTMSFLARFPGRVVNLHPALPGELPGVDAIGRAWEECQRGERTETGVMVHLVPDEGVDDGPVLGTATVPIEPDDTLAALTERVHRAEHRLLVEVLAAFHPQEVLQ